MAAKKQFEYTCTLSDNTLGVAKRELNENPDTRLLELKAFRDRLLQYPGLKPNTNPHFLLRFLRARKFDQERTFQLILNYYKMRKEEGAVFTGLKPSNVAVVYRSGMAFPHSHRDRMGRKVYRVYPTRMDTDSYTTEDVFKMEFLNLNKLIEDEETQVRGITLIVDHKGYTMADALKLNISFARRMCRMWQDAFPARIKNFLIVNEPSFIDGVISLFTQFMTAKLVSRIHKIGTDWKKLHKFIDPDCLPVEYGGTLKDTACPEDWMKEMMACDREMEEESKFGFVDLTIKSDKVKEDAITNMAGTFKKLDL